MWGALISMAGAVASRNQTRRTERDQRALHQRIGDPSGERVFISYSRSEAALVMDLVEQLDRLDIATFVDVRNLEPGVPWDETLPEAITASDVLVFVVSYRSVWESAACESELAQAIAEGKRIILAIAEPVALPDQLVDREWIDLRTGRFRRVVSALAEQLARPQPPTSRPPMSGIGLPRVVWFAACLAVLTAILSIPLVWTIVLPVVLLPLPFRILTRDFAFQQVWSALLGEAVALFVLTGEVFLSGSNRTDSEIDQMLILDVILIPIPLVLVLVLRSRSFRRWMTPPAARPLLPALPPIDEGLTPAPQKYAVHSAPQDERYVQEFVAALDAQGHKQLSLEDGRDNGAVELRFISKFNDKAQVVSDRQPGAGAWTLPIMISEPDDDLPEELQRTQWLDLRTGGRVRRTQAVEYLAAWFDRPTQLLRPLGVATPHNMPILPRGVRALRDLVWVCLAVVIISALTQLFLAPADFSRLDWTVFSVCSVGFIALGSLTIDQLSQRRPTRSWAVYVPTLVVLLFFSSTTLFGWDSVAYVFADDPQPTGPDPLGAGVSSMAIFLSWIILPIGWLATYRETAMWISTRTEADVGQGRGSLRGALGRARSSLRTTATDTFGSSFRAQLQRRRSAPPPSGLAWPRRAP